MSELDWGSLQKEAASAGLLPVGDYTTIVVEAASTTSSNGKPMVKVKLRVTDGPQKDKPVWNQFVVSAESPIALRMFFQHMAAYGLDSAFFAGGPSMEDVARALVNRVAVVSLEVRPWQGQDRNGVTAVKPIPAGTPLPPGAVVGPAANGGTPGGPPSPMAAQPPAAAAPSAPTIGAVPSVGSTPPAPPARPF